MSGDGRWLRGFIAVALVFCVHEALFRGLRIDGVRPDFLLGAGIVAGIVGGPDAGAVLAFVAALMGDLFVNTPFGLSALVACILAFLAGSIRLSLGTNARWVVPVLTAFGSMVGEVVWAAIGTVLGLPGLLHPHLAVIAAVVATVNIVWSVPAAVLMRWVFQPGAERSYAA